MFPVVVKCIANIGLFEMSQGDFLDTAFLNNVLKNDLKVYIIQ